MTNPITKFKNEFNRDYGQRMAKIYPSDEERNLFLNTMFYELERNDVLHTCSKQSIIEAIINVAALKLNPAASFQEVYVLPFGKKGSEVKKAQVVIGYRGYIALGINTGTVRDIYAEVVYEGDVFKHNLGTNPYINHEKSLKQNLSKPLFFYACARLPDDHWKIFIWTISEAYAFKARFSRPGSFWNNQDLFIPMCLKQVIRKLFNTLPKHGNFARAMVLENESENEEFELQKSEDIKERAESKPENTELETELSRLMLKLKISSEDAELLNKDFKGDTAAIIEHLKKESKPPSEDSGNQSNIQPK